MNFTTIDFNNDFWKLRALHVPDAPFVSGESKDTFIWFLAELSNDAWISLALSDRADQDAATRILNAVDHAQQHALLAFLGREWDIIETDPVAHAQSMRDIISVLTDEQLESLRNMSTEEIKTIRSSNEKLDQWIDSIN